MATTLRILLVLFALGVAATRAPAADITLNTQDFPPFTYQQEGVVSGPATEILRAVCGEMRANCAFRLLPWSRAQQEVKDGQANGMYVIGWNEQRAKWLHFTPPVITTEYGFFVRADNQLEFKNLADVAGLKVGVYGPSNTATSLGKIRDKMVAENLTPITIDMRPDDEAGFRKLSHGRIDAVFSNRDVGHALIAKLGLKDSVRYAGRQRQLKYFIGFSLAHNDKSTLTAFDAAYRKLYEAGTVKAILDKYGMQAADPN